jgi:hypothetical protein
MPRREPGPRADAWRVFRAPLLLGLLIVTGLAAALTGEEPLRWFCWLALATPLLLCLWYPLRAALGRQR